MSRNDPTAWEKVNRAVDGDTETAEAFRDLLARSGDPDLEPLLEGVDHSDYSLGDWVEALVEFDRWLAERGVEARPFPDMVGYVQCCTAMNAPQIRLPILKVIVNQSLTDFGFDATSDVQSRE